MKTNFLIAVGKIRYLALLTILMQISMQTWGAGSVSVTSSTLIFPKGTTTYTTKDWLNAGAPSTYSATATDYTINSAGSWTLYNAADYNQSNGLQLKASGGYIETTISSPAGVDVEIKYKGSNTNKFTFSLTGATNQTVGSNALTTITLSTTNTSATLKILKGTSGVGYVQYIKITPKTSSASCASDPTIGAAQINGSVNVNHYASFADKLC